MKIIEGVRAMKVHQKGRKDMVLVLITLISRFKLLTTSKVSNGINSDGYGGLLLVNTTTPLIISKQIRDLCEKINPECKPFHIEVNPDKNSIPHECFENVKLRVRKQGGSIQHGWYIWEWPTIYVEAEFHAVWVSPSGEFVDITPNDYGVNRILFLPDRDKTFTGQRVDNVRIALRNDPNIIEFIKNAEQVFLAVQENDINTLKTLNSRKKELLSYLNNLNIKFSRNDPCFCGSGLKYKKCCGGF